MNQRVNVKLIGEIDAHTAPEVREALLQSCGKKWNADDH